MNAFDIVDTFEKRIAEYAGSKYCVAVDTGSAALFLCCKLFNVSDVFIPKRTFPSVPASIIHAGGRAIFEDLEWSGEYSLWPYPIIDSALRMRRGMHIPNTYRVLSFHYKKHLKIGRGGAILLDDEKDYEYLKKVRFHGRSECDLMDDDIQFLGYPFHFEPERAAKGLHLMMYLPAHNEDLIQEYPDLSTMKAFK